MGSDRVRLIIWGAFGCFGFLVFLLILKFWSRLDAAKCDPPLEKSASLRRKRNPLACLLTEGGAAVVPTVVREFPMAKLEEATDHFNALNLIKIGSSGDFFRGVVEEEHIVVKRMSADAEIVETPEFDIYAAEWSPRHVVPLLGRCSDCEGDQREKFLVYKWLSNGDLATALAGGRRVLGVSGEDDIISLPWIIRLKIAAETAEALCHLHYDCRPPLLHKDIKSSSILLTDEFEVRLGSLSYVQKAENEAVLSYDVFCFGKVLLDLISGLDVSGCEDPYAEGWVIKALQYMDSGYTDGLLSLIDPSLVVEEDFTREILGVAALARACLDPKSLNSSLNMRTVRQALYSPQSILV